MEEISTDAKLWEYFMTYADNDVMDLGQNDEETQSSASSETDNDAEKMAVETGELICGLMMKLGSLHSPYFQGPNLLQRPLGIMK